jgi:hypothetical protein
MEKLVSVMESYVGKWETVTGKENDGRVVIGNGSGNGNERARGMGILIWMGKASGCERVVNAQVMGSGNGEGVAGERVEVMD